MERNIIAEIMESKHLTLMEFAKQVGYDPSVISRVRNRLQKMSHRMAFEISRAFDYDLTEIMEIEVEGK